MKTIGVLGGIGPQATMDFVARVHRVSQRHVPPQLNAGYPPLLVWFLRHAPVLVDDRGRPRLPIEPDPRLFEAAVNPGLGDRPLPTHAVRREARDQPR